MAIAAINNGLWLICEYALYETTTISIVEYHWVNFVLNHETAICFVLLFIGDGSANLLLFCHFKCQDCYIQLEGNFPILALTHELNIEEYIAKMSHMSTLPRWAT